jgi:hypothetical protein
MINRANNNVELCQYWVGLTDRRVVETGWMIAKEDYPSMPIARRIFEGSGNPLSVSY